MPQPSYLPDLTPCDFWLFCRLKTGLWGQCFATPDVRCSATAVLYATPKEAFHECFQAWQNHWRKCVCVCVCGGCVRACICVHMHEGWLPWKALGFQVLTLYSWILRMFWYSYVCFWGVYGEINWEQQSNSPSPLGTGPGVGGQLWAPATP